ncbi:MAG: DEAD/DEAH box helicase [Planctomycetota bacterium]
MTSDKAKAATGGFQEFRLHKAIQKGVDVAGYGEPRPIQRKAIPAAMKGHDVLALAQTGTGKTCAFAVPILDHILDQDPKPPSALVLAPTRELALQIEGEFKKLAKFTDITTQTVFGGVGVSAQVSGLKRRPDVIIACPGRLLDLLGERQVDLRNIDTLVLDEADHMFDQGFLPDVRRILAALPKDRQNLLFSATMPREIEKLVKEVLHEPDVIELAHSTPAETIEHVLYPVAEDRKMELLDHLLRAAGKQTAIVFVRTKRRAKWIAQRLEMDGHRATALQGNMSQNQRNHAMDGFRKGGYQILVATDIAARGIDVAAVGQVINFDVPNVPDAYIHRIGRTGRSEVRGRAATLVTKADFGDIKAIEQRLGARIERIYEPGFGDREARHEAQRREQTARRNEERESRAPRAGGGGPRRGGGRGGGRGRARAGAESRFDGPPPATRTGSSARRRRGGPRRRGR